MYEAQCAVVGTIITNPVKRRTPSGDEVLNFRMASNARRQDRNTGEWSDGGTLYLTVTCWRKLVTGVGASLMKGDPVFAYGQLRTNEYTTREGVERADLDMSATAVGPDLSRCIVKVERSKVVSLDATNSTEITEITDSTEITDREPEDASSTESEPVFEAAEPFAVSA